MLMGRLGDSLAAALTARAQASRSSRSEGGFGAQLDSARDSIRESRESRKVAKSDRAESRDECDEASDADAPDKPHDDGDVPVSEVQNSAAESGLIAAPIVVVTVAGPTVPTADGSTEENGHSSEADIAAAIPAIAVPSTDTPQVPVIQTNTGSHPVIDTGSATTSIASTTDAKGCKTEAVPEAQVDTQVDEASVATTDVGLAVSEGNAEAHDPIDAASLTNRAASAKNSLETSNAVAVHESTAAVKNSPVQKDVNRDDVVDRTDARTDGKSIREVRISDALERALQGDSRQPGGDGATSGRGSHEHAAFNAAGAQGSTQANASSNATATLNPESTARPTGVSEVIGDATAAAIGKFLVGVSKEGNANKPADGDKDAAASKTNLQPAASSTMSAATSATTVGSKAGAPAVAGSTFNQILATRLDPASSMSDSARVLAANSGNGRHQVTLKLSPAELGDLRLDVRMEAGAMSLRVDADNADAGRLIESRLGELREALSAHGISIERAEVVVRGDASANSGFEHRSASDDASHRQHSARNESGDGSWNFNSGHAFTGGDRSGRSDSNPWWQRGESPGVETESVTPSFRNEERSLNTVLQNGSLDLVA